MRIEDIKDRFSMKDVLARCDIRPDRHDFCKCCFHSGDNTASMKIYEKGFYCFGCGKGGDFIKFVQLYHHLNFREACEWISGEELTGDARYQIAVERLKRKEKERHKKELQDKLTKVNNSFSGLWQTIQSAEPMSEEWATAYNKWQLLSYQQEALIDELGAT